MKINYYIRPCEIALEYLMQSIQHTDRHNRFTITHTHTSLEKALFGWFAIETIETEDEIWFDSQLHKEKIVDFECRVPYGRQRLMVMTLSPPPTTPTTTTDEQPFWALRISIVRWSHKMQNRFQQDGNGKSNNCINCVFQFNNNNNSSWRVLNIRSCCGK